MTTGARELREWVEELASQLERDGMPRMAGRIFAWLLVCDPAEQSLDDLRAALQGSKASMSTMTRLLTGMGLVERIRRPGARRDVFRVRDGGWDAYWEAQMARLRQIAACLGRGAALVSGRPAAGRARIEGVLEQYRFLEGALPLLSERWKVADAEARRRPHATSRRRGAARPRRTLRASRA